MDKINRDILMRLAKDKGIKVQPIENTDTGEHGLFIKNTIFYNPDHAHSVLKNWELANGKK